MGRNFPVLISEKMDSSVDCEFSFLIRYSLINKVNSIKWIIIVCADGFEIRVGAAWKSIAGRGLGTPGLAYDHRTSYSVLMATS